MGFGFNLLRRLSFDGTVVAVDVALGLISGFFVDVATGGTVGAGGEVRAMVDGVEMDGTVAVVVAGTLFDASDADDSVVVVVGVVDGAGTTT